MHIVIGLTLLLNPQSFFTKYLFVVTLEMVENMESVTSASDCSNQETKTEYVETPFDYDDILNHLGQMGKYQLHTVLWLCLASLFPGIVVMSYTFTGGVPYYRYL